MLRFFRLFLFFVFSSSVWAITFPILDSQVVDTAGLFSAEQKSHLVSILKNEENNSTNQIVVVTLKTLDGNDISEYGYQLGRKWGIGDKKKNNGVVLIIAPNERKVRIEVGYGLEGALSDASSKLIISNIITPYFKKGDYYGGTLHGVESIIGTIKGEYHNDNLSSNNMKKNIPDLIIIFPLLFLFIVFLLSFAHQTPQKRPIGVAFLGGTVAGLLSWGMLMIVVASIIIAIVVFLLILFGGFGKSTSSHSSYGNNDISFGGFNGGNYSSRAGFGGFSGGGGSFGGGGASGDW